MWNKSVFTALTAAGIDEVADIRIACGDHAIERCVRPFSKETSAEYCCTAALSASTIALLAL